MDGMTAKELAEKIRPILQRCRTVLGNMALENEGAIFRRWPINHEPLRADARNLLPFIDDHAMILLDAAIISPSPVSTGDRR